MTPRQGRVVQATAAVLTVAGLVVLTQIRAATLTFVEDFDVTTNRDAATTATWDTAASEVRLPSGSASWTAIDNLTGLDVTAFAFSPSYGSDGTAFAGTASGIYRTTDGGGTWVLAAKTSRAVVRIAVTPSFASDGTAFAITNGDGLWRTIDRGASWSKISAGSSGFGVAVSPSYASDRTVFVSTFTSIQKSTDGGASWTTQNGGIDGAVVENGDLRGVAVSRNYGSDQTVFATALGAGVYRSTDGGGMWATANPPNLAVSYATVVATGVSGRVAAAFLDEAYSSKDNGGTWTRVYAGDVHDLAYGADGSLFLATASGPLRSGTSIASGWPSGAAKSIAVAATYPASGSVLVGRASGAYRTTTGYASSALAVSKVIDTTPYRITSATITPTTTLPAGTSVTYHLSVADASAKWEGPVTPGTAWTFKESGSSLRWRATLATTDSSATPALQKLTVAYEADDALRAPTPKVGTPTTSSIRWSFTDHAADETGFELHAGTHGPAETVVVTTKPKTTMNLTFLDEAGLTPNVEVCDRHLHTLRGEEVSPPSESYPCVVTLAAVPPAPTAGAIAATTVALTLVSDTRNPADTELAIRDSRSSRYVGADGTFGATSPTWKTKSGWGPPLTVRSLTPETNYSFCVLARNRNRVETACSATVAVQTAAEAGPIEVPPTNQPPVNQPPVNQPPVNQPPVNDGGAPPVVQPPTNQPPVNQPPVNEAPVNQPSVNEAPVNGGAPIGPTSGTVSAAALPTISITVPADGTVTNAQSIVAAGVGPAAAPVSIAIDGAVVGGVVSDAAGSFALLAPPLPDGAHTATATATVSGGVAVVATTRFTVDRTPPPTPVVHAVRSVDRVESRAVRDAFDVTVELRGTLTAEEFAALDALLITIASDPVTFTYRPTSREWTYQNTLALGPGSHTVRVASRDRAGNVSLLAQTLTFVIPPAQCGDGVDNDTDGVIDFPNDPDCRSVVDDREEREGVIERAVTAVTTATTATAKAVATTTTTAARATAKAAERSAVVVQQQVLDNPTVEVAAERVVAPTVTVVVAASTATTTAATGFQIVTYLQYLFGLIASPGQLLGRRKRKSWGTVYASASKRPLDLVTVRLIDDGTGTVAQTQVTDHLGRYQFTVKRAGTYRMEAQKPGYTFPSAILKGRREDTTFSDLYHGGPLTVTDAGAIITANIPIDQREGKEEPDAMLVRRHYLRLVSQGVSVSGLVLSIVSFAISPRPLVGGVLGVNVLLYLLFRRMGVKTRRSWGAIIDAAVRTPIHLAVARLFDTEFNKLLETAVTDRYGRYRFLVGKNVYYVTGQKPGYALAKSDPIDLTRREGVVGVDLKLKPMR